MNRFFFIIALAFTVVFASAQDKSQSIALSPIVQDLAEPFPATAKVQLEHKLSGLLTSNGIVSQDYMGQFFITATATPLTKDILGTAPTQIAETMEITFYIADYFNQIVFSSITISTKGVGSTDAKAYMDALKRINVQSKEMRKFVNEGKAKIVAYYDEQAPILLKKAAVLAEQKQYEEAMFICSTIPAESKFFDEATAKGIEFYRAYYSLECQKNLNLAKMAWAAEQNADGAYAAGEYLALIYPDAPCYEEAEKLYKEIKAKVLDDWKFEIKKYQDGVDLSRLQVNAWREVGVAFGKGQQPTTTNLSWLR